MDKFLKGLFSKPPQKTDRKDKYNKNLSPKQITIAITAIIFLVTVVLFSTNIDTILDFFGARADQPNIEISLDPPEGPQGDPPEGPPVTLNPNESYTYYLNVKSLWGIKLNDDPNTVPYLPFRGVINFLLPVLDPTYIASIDINVLEHPANTANHDTNMPLISIADSPGNCPMIGICNWRPTSTFDGEFVDPVIEITITATNYDPSSVPSGGFDIDFEIDSTVYYNPYIGVIVVEDPNDPSGWMPPPPPANGTIHIPGITVTPEPAFTLEVIDPVDTNFPEDPNGFRHHRIVNAGLETTYDIEITTNETFGIAGDNMIDLTSLTLEAAKNTLDSGVLDYYFTPNPYNTGPNNPYDDTIPDIVLTIITDPSLTSAVSFPFTIQGMSNQTASYAMGGGTGTFLVVGDDTARLSINLVPDFSIVLDVVADVTIDDLGRDIVVPGGQITYGVILNRMNGFTGNVTASSVSLDNNWPTEIASYDFGNGGLFIDDGSATQNTTITINITDTVDTQIIDITNFTIDGDGDIDGDSILEHRESNSKTFSIVDYTITIENTPQTAGAGEDAIYTITITTENQFNDIVYLNVLEDLLTNYPTHITGWQIEGGTSSPIVITSSDTFISRQFTINTNPSSPGTSGDFPAGIPFHITGDSFNLNRYVESNEGILHITTNQDFRINVIPIKNRIIPGGEATYTVTSTSILGFSGDVNLSTSWDIPNMPSYISNVTFDNSTITVDGAGTILHVTTTIDAPPVSSGTPEGQFIVIGTSSVDATMSRFANADLDIVDFSIQITDPLPDLNGDSIRNIQSGNQTTYTATVTRMNNLNEDIILSTDLVSINGSISSLTFEGSGVSYIGGNYVLQHAGLDVQFVTLRVTTFDPIPAETINFYIYGDVTTNEGDALTRQSNRGILNITNDYGFNLLINPPTKTIAPTGSTEYTITVNRLNNFTGDITLVSNIVDLNGEQVAYSFDKITLFVDALNPDSDIAILTIIADADALGKQISFQVWGNADLAGDGNIIFDNVEAELIIIDFTLELTNSPQNIGPGDTVQYTVHLQATGTTTFTNDIFLTTNINDSIVDTYNIIETAWFTPTIVSGGVDSVNGIDAILNVRAFNTISNSIPNHSITFTVYGDAIVDTVNLTKSDNGLLNFNNTPYFSLIVTPADEYSYPGGSVTYAVQIERFHGLVDNISLLFNATNNLLIQNYTFGNGGTFIYGGSNIQTTTLNVTVIDTPITAEGNIVITITANSVIGGTEIAIVNLHIRDFDITVTPINGNETYPSSTIQYNVVLTRYNTFANNTEAINLTSNVYRPGTLDHIMPFNPIIHFDNNGVFPAGIGNDSAIMTVSTTAKADDLPTLAIDFVVTGTGITTSLARQDSNYLVIVAVPEFSLSLSPITDGRGIPTETVTYSITLTRDIGFIADVTISNISIVDGLGNPLAQATPSIQNNNYVFSGADATRELYITLADDINYWGDYIVTITGTATGISDTYASAPLVIMDFTISLTDNNQTVTPNSNVTYEVVLDRFNGYDRAVIASTSLTDLIGGGDILDVAFNLLNDTFPTTTATLQTTLMTVYTTATASEQTINFTVTGTDGTPTALQRSADGILNIVSLPDYNLILTAKNGIDSGMPTERVTYVITLETLNNFTGNVTITDIILSNASDITTSWLNDDNILSSSILNDSIELQLDLGINIVYGNRTVQVRGSGSSGVRDSNIVNLSIFDFDIQIDAPKNQTITAQAPNNVATYGITLIRHNSNARYDRAIEVVTDLTPANYPGIISSSVFENGGTFGPLETTTNLIVYAGASAPTIGFDVTGTDTPTNLNRLDSGSLTINDEVTSDYLVNISPSSRTIEPGGATTYIVSIIRINGWANTITLTTNLLAIDNRVESAEFDITDLPDGVNEATLSVIAKADATSSTTPTTFTVFGDSNGTQRTADADLIIYKETVVPPPPGGGGPTTRDFSITINPDEQTVMAGETTTYIVMINRTNFTGDILLSNVIANNSNIKSATLDKTIIDNSTRETTLTVVTETGAETTIVPIIIDGTAIIDRRETERSGEAILYIRREEVIEEIIVPEEELPSTGPELTWLLLGLAALIMTTITYKQLQFKLEYNKENK